MAPEISTGNYNKQIDIYAAGIILYEMLTGRVPFDGESAGEILMKHLTTPPDLSKVPAEYLRHCVQGAGEEPGAALRQHDRDGPRRRGAGRRVLPRAGRGAHPHPLGAAASPARSPQQPEPVLTALPAVSRRAQLMELCGSMLLAVLFTGLGSVLWTAIIRPKPGDAMLEMGRVFFPTVAACWAILLPSKFWTERRGDSWLRRFALLLVGGLVGLGCWWMDGGSLAMTPVDRRHRASLLAFVPSQGVTEASYFSYYALAFFAMRWWRMTGRRRAPSFQFRADPGAGFWGLVLMLLIRPLSTASPGLLVLVMTAAIVQLVSPWEQPPAPAAKRLRLRYA